MAQTSGQDNDNFALNWAQSDGILLVRELPLVTE